ncbi:MAG: TPM domain-containing protein [Pseudomonadota bacterium]
MKTVLQIIAIIALIACFTHSAVAQTFPAYTSTTVNDFADLLSDADEATLHTQLEILYRDTGIEMTVVTLPSQTPYAPNLTMEAFATALFNHWGVGNAQRNDGIMVLVLPDDRAMRIELGAGFGQDWNGHAARIVQRDFLPAFREGDYVRGIMTGSTSTIQEIAIPFSEGATQPPRDVGFILVASLFAVFGAVLLFLRRILDLFTRMRACPKCGQKGTLRVIRRTTMMATRTTQGQKEKTTYCTNCDYEKTDFWRTARLSSNTSSSRGGRSSFGGGRSGGGGASGRW